MIKKKLVIVGDGGTGKTSLLHVFSKGIFPEEYVPTVFETTKKVIQVEDTTVNLSLWDTAGQEDYDRLRYLVYPGSDVILITFSCDDLASFENIENKWIEEILFYCKNIPVLLICCKSDLRFEPQLLKRNQPLISYQQGLDLANKIGAYKYFECSARWNSSVELLFQVAATAALELKPKNKLQCLIL